MSDAESLSAVIGDIYDAALDPALWPDVLEQCTKFVGGCAAGLYSKDSVRGSADIDPSYTFGCDPRDQQNYMKNYARMDPTTTGYFFFGVGEVVANLDIIPYEELSETRFYQEYVKPLGWVDAVSSVLEKTSTSYSIVSIMRHERDGIVDDTCRERMRLLAPHIRRAVLIGKTIRLTKIAASTFAETLDRLAAGVFLVDSSGRLIHANARGHAMLAEDAILRASGGRLVANDQGADQVLRDAFAVAEDGDCGLGARGIAVPLCRQGRQYVADVLPLTSGTRRKTSASPAVAAVFVRQAELGPPAAPEVIAKLYSLTPSELRVLLTLFESNGVTEISATLGISEATAKTHLRRLFEKTGTERQADLVKLVAGFALPAA